MRNRAKVVLTGVAMATPASAFAHPGPHRNEAVWSLLHVITNADHRLMIGAGAAALATSIALVLLARKACGSSADAH